MDWNRMPSAVLGLAAAAFPLLPLPAQQVGGAGELLYRIDGDPWNEELGHSLAAAGDVDGDGLPDWIGGAPHAGQGLPRGAGTAYVYSGLDGRLIGKFDGAAENDNFGWSVDGAGDLDGDGHAELIIGAWRADPGGLVDAGSAYVYSGATGALIWRFDGTQAGDRFGESVAGAGDVDGDGVGDLIVGGSEAVRGGFELAGQASVYSGATGLRLFHYEGSARRDAIGKSVSPAGDVNGDGRADFLIGAPRRWINNQAGCGTVFLHSGADGAPLRAYEGDRGDHLGWSVANAGDIDGDGVDDALLGAPYRDTFGAGAAGSAEVRSGADGSVLWRHDADVGGQFGQAVAGVGDVDGDGLADFLIGSPWRNTGRWNAGVALLYSGATGALLWQFEGRWPDAAMGHGVAGAGDLAADGRLGLLVGASHYDWYNGAVYLYRIDPFLRVDGRELSASAGAPVELMVDFPDSEAGLGFVVLASLVGKGPTTTPWGLSIPLTADSLFEAMRFGFVPPVLVGSPGALDSHGRAVASLHADSWLAPHLGRTVHFCAVSFGGRARASSVAHQLRIVP